LKVTCRRLTESSNLSQPQRLSLRSYVEAMGGHLDIRAVFPDGEIMIEHLSDAEDHELVHS
jgi:hypothetical protein